MATEVEISTAIDTAQAQQGLTGLRKGLKELISLQQKVGTDSKNFGKLQEAINTTEGKIGDLTDSFQTLRGSGVERVNSSINLFREGLLNADTGKLKLGLQGIGTAMKAIPIFLLIEGVRLLIENFDKVVALFNTGTKQSDLLTASLKAQAKAAQEVTASYDRHITLMQAAGSTTEDVILLQIERGEVSLKALQREEDALYKVIAAKERSGEATEEEKKQLEDLDKKYSQTLTDTAALYLKLDKVREDARIKAAEDAAKLIEQEKRESDERVKVFQDFLKIKNEQEEEFRENKRKLDEEERQRELNAIIRQIEDEKNLRAALAEAQAIIDKEISDGLASKKLKDLRNQLAFERAEVVMSNAERINNITLSRDIELANEQLTVDQRVAIVRKAEEDILAIRTESQLRNLALVQQYANVLGELNNLTNQRELNELRRLEKNKEQAIISGTKTQVQAESEYLKASLNIKKQQFEREKKLKIANVVIDTASALVKTTAQLGGVGALTPAGILMLAGITALGVTQGAAIAAQDFDDSGFTPPTISLPSSSGSGPSADRPPERTPTTFNPQARVSGQGGGTTRVVVLDRDIKETGEKVEVLESRATFEV